MPRFLTAEWVSAFNDAVVEAPLPSESTDGSLAAAGGAFSVRQVVDDVPPDGESVATTLTMADGRMVLQLDGPAAGTDGAGPDLGRPNVTVALAYADAAALSRGDLSPAELLSSGRIRVRGDLAVLVAAQSVMAKATGRLADLQAATTY